jgi:hypothetical protein
MRYVAKSVAFALIFNFLTLLTPAQAAYTGTQQNYTSEGGNLTFTAPAGSKFTSVLFASYGTPNTSTYVAGGCNASNSASIVSTYFVGQTSATIGANNTVFGDPCSGTGKYLAIKLAYTTILTNSVVPTISGTLTPGQTLSATTGTWNVSPDSYFYQWRSAATSNGSYTNISGATSSNYTLTNAEVGMFLKVVVTARNDAGDVAATSAATASSISGTTTTSLSITGAPTTTDFRYARPLIIGVSVNGKVTVRANGIIISGCKNKSTTGLSFTCYWKPATRGYVNLVATYTPTIAGYQTSTSTAYRIFVTKRTNNR